MPIYENKCPRCGGIEEVILHYNEREKEIICKACDIVMVRIISLPAKTASLWNDGWNSGLSGQGVYSHALGKKVHNRREEAKILESKGFVSEKDLAPHWFEDAQAKKLEKVALQDERSLLYKTTLDETGDACKAMEVAFPAKDCLDGTLDSIYDEKISI